MSAKPFIFDTEIDADGHVVRPSAWQPVKRSYLPAEVDALVAFELGDQPLDDRFVPVVAAQVVVAGGRFHFEGAFADVEHRDVEGAAAEVEDEDRLIVALFVEAVGQRRRGRLVDDPLDVEAGDLAGVLGRLPLVVVEVGGDGDDGAVDGSPGRSARRPPSLPRTSWSCRGRSRSSFPLFRVPPGVSLTKPKKSKCQYGRSFTELKQGAYSDCGSAEDG